ncbi:MULTISPECIES: hypothetical protein [Paraburkholderia]|uniref:DUF6891 domain-containing protein n=1 Tax=Paraburkholderia TaxID=1822464 RepID=UPI00224EDF40|nr:MULTISPECIES: hypothetical protein [Paraburkholderia]MCX4164726.1 hypothetical protein [Paraburkholderia megapolitana]MDN7160219.1 hypothetical protein [Paraburkholderia sp. CHISQ3]MDQ6497266.1 hypothetical protein [Paraburkholderia megapolitana]
MTENEDYIVECITKWVWSGFYEAAQIREMMDDILEPDCEVSRLEAFLESEFQRKVVAESSWPAETDCDRLDRVFHSLHEEGICALSNAGYTMSDGDSDVAEVVGEAPKGHYHGYCFYHGQDVERALEGNGVMIAFGDLANDKERSSAVGHRVTALLSAAGFEVSWDGSVAKRIDIPAFDWKRRHA